MIVDLRNTFRVSFVMSDAPMPIASASELLENVQSRPVWDGASISPADADYPRVRLDWHEGHGFVFQCFEGDHSRFLVPLNRGGAWRASHRTMAARAIRFCGTGHAGLESFSGVRQTRPGARVGQNRRFPA